MAYPLMAAKASPLIDAIFVSTDSSEMGDMAFQYGATVIVRPHELCTDKATGEDAFVHGYQSIKLDIPEPIEAIALLMANASLVTPEMIAEGVRLLRADTTLDSAVTVSRYNMWHPIRARRIDADGTLQPFLPLGTFGDTATLSCDRDANGDAWFADMSLSLVRPRCLEQIQDGLPPQRWMGRRIAPIRCEGGLDVDYAWQLPQVEFLLQQRESISCN